MSLVGQKDFRFSVDDFNWEIMGSELTTIGADGLVDHVSYAADMERGVYVPYWYRREHVASRDVLEALQRLLVETDFLHMEAEYVDKHIADGVKITFVLKLAGTTKQVYCSNKFPDGIQRIQRYIREKVVATIPKSAIPKRLTRAQAAEIGAAR